MVPTRPGTALAEMRNADPMKPLEVGQVAERGEAVGDTSAGSRRVRATGGRRDIRRCRQPTGAPAVSTCA